METARRSDELAFTSRGTRLLVVDAAGAGLRARRDEWLPPDATPGDDRRPDVRYVVEPRPPIWNGRAAGCRIVRDGTTRYLGTDADALRRWLRADIAATVAERATAPLVVRAAAVIWRERAIVITGPPGSGVSHLAAALGRLGAAVAADERLVIAGDGDLRPRAAAPRLDPALVVATAYHPGVQWQPRHLHGAPALLPLIECALPHDGAPHWVLRRVARLAPGVMALQGPRPDAEEVAPRILAALDEWLDRPPSQRPPLAPSIARARHALTVRAARG